MWQRTEIMILKEELKQFYKNAIKDLNLLYEKIKQYPLISLLFIIAVFLLIALPHWQVSGIKNVTEKVTLENQSRATFAQILGGIAVGIGIYLAWGNLTNAREGQITERFTRAVEQLGNEKIEIRLGGIYALERIANESEKDYWQIMELLTAYIRENSPTKKDIDIDSMDYLNQPPEDTKVKEDIQAILTVIGKRRYSYKVNEDKRLSLEGTNLRKADLNEGNFNGVILDKANLEEASLRNAKLKEAIINGANLRSTSLINVHLENAEMFGAHLENAQLNDAHLEGTILGGAHLNYAIMRKAHLEGTIFTDANLSYARIEEADFLGTTLVAADLKGAYIKEAKNLIPEQLYEVKTLYTATLDEEIEQLLKAKYPNLFKEPKR